MGESSNQYRARASGRWPGSGVSPLEWDVFVGDLRASRSLRRLGLGCALIKAGAFPCSRTPAAVAATFGSALARAAAQQHHLAADDLSLVLLLPALLVVPGVGADAAFDVNRAPLLKVFAGNLRLAVEKHNVVPLRAVRPVTVFVFHAIVGGQREVCHRHAALRVLDFWVLAKIADQNDLVDACHKCLSCLPRIT